MTPRHSIGAAFRRLSARIGVSHPRPAPSPDPHGAAMNSPIHTRLEAFAQQKRVHANSLIVSVFGDMVVPRGSRIWLGSLIRLLEPLGLSERLVRTTVFRLAKAGWLRTEACGRRSDYLLTEQGQRRFDEASRHIYATAAPSWDHRWRLILDIGRRPPKEREALRRALFWQGFGALDGECFVHPSADLAAVLDALRGDGLGALIADLMPLLATDFLPDGTASSAGLVARAWNLDALAAAYTQFVATYRPVLAALDGHPPHAPTDAEAFFMRLLLIHDYRRLLLRDPELPDVLLPAGWPGQAARALCRTLYRRFAPLSERHLDACLRLADGRCPPLDPAFGGRFI